MLNKNKKIKYIYSYRRAYLIILKIIKQLGTREGSLQEDISLTREFLSSIFKEYSGESRLEQVNFAFLIPTRASRFNPGYWEEVYDFFPLLRHAPHGLAMEFLASLPPFRIEMYGEEGKPSSGVLIFVPVFDDMRRDYRTKLLLGRAARRRVNDAARLAHDRFGVRYIGLGGILPRITDYGKTVSSKVRVVTTTGHAGTTSLLCSTVAGLVKSRYKGSKDLTIGFVGGGAIGLAAMTVLSAVLPDARFIAYDKRKKVNAANKKRMARHGRKLDIASSNRSLIKESDIIVSAITSRISVKGLDLRGKFIVDDSQPGSFEREEVHQAGGEICWVVGHDESKGSIVTRRGSYSYGPHGLCHENDIWGCEAEVATIASLDDASLAVNSPVSIDQVVRIGKAFKQSGVGVAKYQSHGQLN